MNPVSVLGLIVNLYEQVAELSEQLTQVQRANEDLQAQLQTQAPASP